MAKQNKYDIQHLRNLGLTEKQIASIFDLAVKEAAAIGVSIHDFNSDKPFSFADYPQTKARIEKVIKSLQKRVETTIVNGVRSEWTLANNKNDVLCDLVFGDNKSKLTREQERRYYTNNDKALEAFLKRKTAGLNLSDRVWKYTDQFKTEIEIGIDLGLRDGLSAADMARGLKQYLQHPDKLFRRVRDEHGHLHLSKAAKAFHPGAGVYRSSYKNAMRLARTENNMAYRTADHERWQQLDFVVGIEIRLSNNHTLNGRPFTDICDDLKGRYPKDFKFTGWHPACRCHAVSILKTPEELMQENDAILEGKEPDKSSVNEVKDVPDNFKQWINNNEGRIAQAEKRGTLPYFIEDNRVQLSQVDEILPTFYPNITSKIINAEDNIRKNAKFETAVVIDKDGNIVINKHGKSTSVSFTDKECKSMKDCVFTHNHPRGWGAKDGTLRRIGNSFSHADIAFAIKNDMAEMRAVTPLYTFSMKRPKNGWGINVVTLKKDFEHANMEMRKKMNAVINKSKTQEERQRAAERAATLHYHLIWKELAKKYKFEYVKAKTVQ